MYVYVYKYMDEYLFIVNGQMFDCAHRRKKT